jgi:hypothetical protein
MWTGGPEVAAVPELVRDLAPHGPPTMWTAASAIDATARYAHLTDFTQPEKNREAMTVTTDLIDNRRATAS